MTLGGGGRFCDSCQKTVIDFSAMTDAQIIDIFKKSKENPPCGHFHVSQLDRELISPQKEANFAVALWGKMAASLLLLQTLVTTSWSQTTKPVVHVSPSGKNLQKKTKPKTITGKVIYNATGNPLGNARVTIAGTGINATTDSLGRFTLALSGSEPDTIQLSVLAPVTNKPMLPLKTVYLPAMTARDEVVINCGVPAIEVADLVNVNTMGVYQARRGETVLMGGAHHRPPIHHRRRAEGQLTTTTQNTLATNDPDIPEEAGSISRHSIPPLFVKRPHILSARCFKEKAHDPN